jgi:NADPH:quinone reductase-like Zn-dependent oxidoreductase
MQAMRLHARGGPEQLFLDDAPMPELGAGDVLIRVFATGITPTELTWNETCFCREPAHGAADLE